MAFALILFVAPNVFAKQARLFTGTFGSASSTTVNPYPAGPEGVAVDGSSHDVYVTDRGNHRVEKFSAAGVFLSMLGRRVNKTAAEEGRPEAEQNVCPASNHPIDVCQSGEAGSTAGAFEQPTLLAVDNSSDASKGDLYVGDVGTPVAEVQSVNVNATGGTYTLSFEGHTTAPIAYNAPLYHFQGANSIQNALEALFFGPNRLGDYGLKGVPGHFEIEFNSGELYGRNVPQLVADSSGLSGGSATASVATLVQGSDTARVEKLDSSGLPVATWAQAGQLNGSGISAPPEPISGPFAELLGMAVDLSGNLWVSDKNGHVFEFDTEAKFLTDWSAPVREIAVDGEDNIYGRPTPYVAKYDSAGNLVGQVSPSAVEEEHNEDFSPSSIGVDAVSGDLYIAGTEDKEGVVKRYDSSCHPVVVEGVPPGCAAVESFGAGFLVEGLSGVAIDSFSPTDPVYVVEGGPKYDVAVFSLLTVPDVLTTAPSSPTSTSAILTGTINPAGIELNSGLAGCRFEWGEAAGSYEHTVACDKSAAQIGSGNTPVEVHAAISGLRSGKIYHYRLVASNENDFNGSVDQPSFGQDLPFGPPSIEAGSILEADSTSVVVQAQVNPDSVDTRVRVEYGFEAGSYALSTPEVDFGVAGTAQTRTFELTGLQAGRTYHYRLVAENVLGEGGEAVKGPDQTFGTQSIGGFTLPDGRAWELVSPPNKHGAKIEPIVEEGVVQAAANGDAVSYLANAPTEDAAAGNTSPGVQVLSTRSASGWSSRDIATPHESAAGAPLGPGPEYKFFSEDLSSAIVEPIGGFVPSISAEASEQTPYLHTDFPAGEPAAICSVSCFRPLISGKSGFENVPTGTKFGGGQEEFLGATPDATHIVLRAHASLVEGAPPASLYEWSAGHLQLISLLPGGAPAAVGGVLGGASTKGNFNTRKAISADGSRVVWSEAQGGGNHLYLSDAGGEPLRLDRVEGGSGNGAVAPVFQDASSDDSTIFFTDAQRLTAGAGSGDLYRCQVVTGESGELECILTDLTPANGTESAAVQGFVPGVSEHGSFVYFFADGVLAHNRVDNGHGVEEATPADCAENNGVASTRDDSSEANGNCNLYVSHDGATSFIASLSSASLSDWYESLGGDPTRVSPNGEWLEFMSQRPLTGYDSRDGTTGAPVAEIYLYGAAAKRIVCASCEPTGARPHGTEFQNLLNDPVNNSTTQWIFRGRVAALVPTYTTMNTAFPGYQDRYLSDSGRLFFDALDPLVPQDSNGTADVYEYEPTGTGACENSSATFSPSSNGCVSLISSGTSALESAFLDASASGDDVFFLTAAQLSHRDSDSAYDVYDARVGGGEAEPTKQVECQGDACQGFVEAPNDPTPDSLTFQGPGNLLAPSGPSAPAKQKKVVGKCAKGRVRVRGRCVKRRPTHKQKKTGKAGKAGTTGRERGPKR